jgi:hypothetical protein
MTFGFEISPIHAFSQIEREHIREARQREGYLLLRVVVASRFRVVPDQKAVRRPLSAGWTEEVQDHL